MKGITGVYLNKKLQIKKKNKLMHSTIIIFMGVFLGLVGICDAGFGPCGCGLSIEIKTCKCKGFNNPEFYRGRNQDLICKTCLHSYNEHYDGQPSFSGNPRNSFTSKEKGITDYLSEYKAVLTIMVVTIAGALKNKF